MDKKFDLKENAIKILLYLIGEVIMAFAITLFIKANVGSDPITIFYSGLAMAMEKTYGVASLIGTGFFLTLALIFARKNIHIGTVLGVLVLGPFVDILTPITNRLFPNPLSFTNGVILMVFAQVILSLSLGIIISLRYGMGGVDAILFKICEVTNAKYQNLKVLIDVVYTVTGVIMGGVIGIGSVFSLATTGYLAVIFVRFMEFKVLRKIGISNELNDLPIKIPFSKYFKKEAKA